MSKVYRVIARVHEMRAEKGKMPCRLYKVGDEFDLSKPEEKEKVCRWAYNAMFPFITILEFDGTIPWEPDADRGFVACPDPHNIVVFEIRREEPLKKRENP